MSSPITDDASANLVTTCYYDRVPNSIEGFFTIRTVDSSTNKIVKEFAKLPARSGQNREVNSSWVSGGSPIPFTTASKDPYVVAHPNEFPTEMWLWLRLINQVGEWAGMKGIGEFRHISTSKTDPNTIQSPGNSKLVRKDIGLHPDQVNPRLKGSAGCVVLACDTPQQIQRILAARQYLNELAKTQKHVRFLVV